MRQNFRTRCLNSDKAHLHRLPNLYPSEIFPAEKNPSKRALVLIPLFLGRPFHEDVRHHCAIASIWARQSWLANTDAKFHGIEVKFYVENKVSNQVDLIFKENGITDEQILWFDGASIEGALPVNGGYATYGAKEGVFFTDGRLSEYEWVFMVDADLFVVSTEGVRMHFFDKFFDLASPDMIGALWVGSKPGSPPYKTAIDNGWCRNGENETTEESINDWKVRIGEFVGEDMLERYMSTSEWYAEPQGGLTAFPAKHFMSERRDVCELLFDASRIACTSEFPLSLWHSMGNPMFCLRTDTDIPVIMMVRDFDETQTKMFWKMKEGTPFLLHYGSTSIEYLWRQGIGAL